ncbi:MAG: hypothetical protein GWM87_08515 [Xanthomonadales bacterium]|nr:hypothetical protein [Xanthomonadales bacterium]NIX12966.1 hypothetical protein [Xanthomonadales bacterium]
MNIRSILLAFLAAATLLASHTLDAVAQDSQTVQKAVTASAETGQQQTQRKPFRVMKPKSNQAGTAAASDTLADPGGDTLDYDCASGNCSCAGAKDCVDMKKICSPGTISCNDYGCTCAENPDSGDDGG